jgi:hypothetical protein
VELGDVGSRHAAYDTFNVLHDTFVVHDPVGGFVRHQPLTDRTRRIPPAKA